MCYIMLNIQFKIFPSSFQNIWVLFLSDPHLSSPPVLPVSPLAVLSPSAAMLLLRCSTPLYGSTLTYLCCLPPCSISSALQPRSSLACCPVLCPSSLSCPWRRSERRWFLAITGSIICTIMQKCLNNLICLHRFWLWILERAAYSDR